MASKREHRFLRKSAIALMGIIVAGLISACGTISERSTGDTRSSAVAAKSLSLGGTLSFRPHRLSRGGGISDNACIRGDYRHVYETDSGFHGREVWLCCIPVEEILRDSFTCAGSLISLTHLGSSDYFKIRYCSLVHPTNTEATYIPVCIPAPLTAPGIRIR